MKRLIALLLAGSAVVDIAQQAYRIDLLDAIARRDPGTSLLATLAASPIVTTIWHWALFLIGFGILALAMGSRKPARAPSLDRSFRRR